MNGNGVLDAMLRLRASLDAVAAALSAPDATRLIAAEAELADALTQVGRVRSVDRADRHALVAEVIRARAALARCRVLGAAAADVTRATLAAQSRSGAYGPTGAAAEQPSPRGRDLDTRI